ncbi:versatile peroxidase VPL1 [Coniochaeta sp. 2T2.1]|nr:versatile peroxidase VPL1 [Coniochaeta sp. 2T2.1]
MHLSALVLVSISLPQIHATNIPSPALSPRKDTSCPKVWTQVKAELNTLFMSGYECNGLARAAIRAVFHDCGSWDTSQALKGGCDGSLVVGVTPDVELDRPENRGLQTIAATLKDLAGKYGTSVADMVVFAGNAAIVLCPGGPRVKTFIGRKDSPTSAPPGGLPNVFDSAANLAALFAQKGLDAEDLAALLGAHSTSTQKFVDPSQANKSQDSTPGQWDVTYYGQTYAYATTGKKDPNIFVFPSDSKLATYGNVGKKFQGFIGNQGKWTGKFADAMERMALFGNDKKDMVDCTNALG